MSGLIKMPTPTSKIPLPKTLSSSRLEPETMTITSPPVSKIPVIKNIKSPDRHENSFSTPNKENIYGGGVGGSDPVNNKRSRIPDIRSKISPARDSHDIDGGYKSDHSARSGSVGSSSTPSRIPGLSSKTPSSSKLPVSPPSKIPTSGSGSRIPTLSGSPSKQATMMRSSTESLDDLDWDGQEEVMRHRRSMTPGEEVRGGRTSSISDLVTSSSSSSYSPHKRSREENIRTSPDGESISPSKSRRGGSPSKIPIAGAYLRSSQEDLLTQSPLRHSSQLDDDEEEMVIGGGEGMAMSVLGEEFLNSQDGVRRQQQTEVAPLGKSRIPAPSTPRAMPELNWSISREDTPPRESTRDHSPTKQFRGSQSTSRLPDPPKPEVESARHVTRHVTTSQLPLYQRSNSTDSNSSGDSQTRRRKNFEAFVMTGDRMINLAKTPANIDFQSKYYKPDTNAAVKSLGNKFEGSEPVADDFEGIVPLTNNSLPSSPVAEEPSHRRTSDQRQNRRSYVRGSKSEDQLTGVEGDNSSEEERMLINSSCHTLLDTETMPRLRTVTAAPPTVSSESSSSRSMVSGVVTRQPSDETTSPDFSSSSLISCSEHYNGDSLLDPGQLSPVSPSSPDTPEWSLIANGDSFHKDDPGTRDNGLITSKDNRVIITINKQDKERLANGGLVSPVSSSGTITPTHGSMMSPPQPSTSPPPSMSSEDDMSDMDSLHSYHPPVKIVDIPSANRLAKRLYNLEGFRKSDISRHLSKNNDFSKAVAEEYCKLFTFSHQTLDEALRMFLQQFCLTGETQDRERVLLHFSKRFLECNPALRGVTYQSHDAVHTLTCAIMLLNTDLHNEALQQRRMTVDEFVENLAELNDGTNFPDSLLRDVYSAIKSDPIEWVIDESGGEESEPTSTLSQDSNIPPQPHHPPDLNDQVSFSNHQSGGINPFLAMPDPETSVDYKRGYVMRKSCFDANKKKTKMGKRSWKMYYLTLRDLVLYCFKDEKSAQVASSYESPMAAIRIHHSIASIAGDYTKKQFVFRLQTCDRAEYLFQTSDMKELETWVDTINTVVSRYSSPPLPAPCSSSIKFQRPLYPSSRSNHSLSDQMTSHNAQVRELSQQLSHHTANTPDRNAKAAILANFREKREFLEQELERFSIYIAVLENLMSKHENNQILSSPLKIIMN